METQSSRACRATRVRLALMTPAAKSPAPVRRWLSARADVLRRRWPAIVLGLVALALLWTAVIGWWLPGFVRPRIEAGASQALGTAVTLDRLSVQPWTLRIAAEGLHIAAPAAAASSEAAAQPLATLAKAEAQLSLKSLWHLAPVLRSLTLTQPEVWVARTAPQRFNFSPILDHFAAQPAAPDSGQPARFALYNIRLEGGALHYDDRVLAQSHRIEALRLGVPFLSNLPSDLEVQVQPLLEARVDGSEFKVTGESKPFAVNRPTELSLNWRAVQLADWAKAAGPLLPPQARVEVAQGALEAALTLRFEAPPGGIARLAVQGRVALNDVQARWPAGGWAGQWKTLVFDGLDLAPLERRAQLATLSLDGLQVTQARPAPVADAKAPPPPPSSAATSASASAPAAAAPVPAWQWSLGKLHLAAEAVRLLAPGGDSALPRLGPVQLDIDGLTSAAKAPPAKLSLTAADATGTALQVQGTLQPVAPSAALQIALKNAALAPWLQALALPLPLQVQEGRLAATVKLQADDEALSLSDGELSLTGLKSHLADLKSPDHVDLAALNAQGLAAQVRLPGSAKPTGLTQLRLATLAFDRLDVAASRDAQQRWRLVPAAAASAAPNAAPKAAPAASAAPSAAAGTQPSVEIDSVRCTGCQIAVQDETVSPAARFTLAALGLAVQGVSSDLSRSLAVELTTEAQGKGQISVKGTVRPQPLKLEAQVGVKNLDLRAVQPYLVSQLNLTLKAAQAQAAGQLSLAMDGAQNLSAHYKGRAGLTDLATQDSVTSNDFVRWRSLDLDGLDVAWQQGGSTTADLGRVSLDNFYGRLIVHPDGHLNLADVRKLEKGAAAQSITTPRTAAESAEAAASSAATAPKGATGSPAPKLRWQRIALSDGRVDFTDNFVKPNYSARLNKLVGEVSALGGESAPPATVSLGAALDDGAPITITGRLQPFGAQLFADIEGSAKGIELTRLSGYAERYAGYAVEKGSLSVNVHYLLDQGRLQASNHVFLDQLTFGDKVESPTATKLPVLLAISLLKNSRGEIDIDLPVAGSLEDPQFSVGGIIARLLVNLLTRALTSPFSLLAGLAGGDGGGELGYVPFEAGSAQLSDAARASLDTLAKRLVDRPALKLEATGRADPSADAQGLRQRRVQRLLREAKAQALGIDPRQDGDNDGKLAIAPDERDKWLTAAYKAAEIKKPRNLIGIAKTQTPAEMEALLMADTDTSPAALQSLADRRADRVNAYLDGKLSADRVLVTRSVVGTDGLAKDQGPTTRVQFDLR